MLVDLINYFCHKCTVSSKRASKSKPKMKESYYTYIIFERKQQISKQKQTAGNLISIKVKLLITLVY